MKSAVFARPNLKVFLFGAILIAIVQNFIANGHSQATVVRARVAPQAAGDADLQRLVAQAEEDPQSELYARISRWYEKKGDMRKALFYLRKAQMVAQFEESND